MYSSGSSSRPYAGILNHTPVSMLFMYSEREKEIGISYGRYANCGLTKYGHTKYGHTKFSIKWVWNS